MPLNRFDPSSALSRLQSDLSAAGSHASHGGTSVHTSTEGDDIVITVEGIDPSDVDVQVGGGRLTIKGASGGSTSESHDDGGAHFSSSSSSSSSFSRSFSIPDGVEQSDVSTEPAGNGVKVRIRNAA
jgi:HSP20 family molecular chaperone IbpA